MTSLTCWQCGTALTDLSLPLGRSAECPQCRAALHACLQCEWYDPRASHQCRETQAEPGREKERANFCDWFLPRDRAQAPAGGGTAQARAGLDALFGTAKSAGPHESEEAARKALDDLFGKK